MTKHSLTSFHFSFTYHTYKNACIIMIIYLINHYVHASLYMFQIAIFVKNRKFRMKCVDKYDASAEDASRKLLDMLIDHRNLL